MQKKLAILFALVIWFAVIMQFVLMIQNRTSSVGETIVRFFSFFTILTNLMAALYFTGYAVGVKYTHKTGNLTAVTLYIFIVGLVYQLLLRHLWQPQGMQRLVDELLHSVDPLLVLLFWLLYEDKAKLRYAQVKGWLIYPLLYLVYILIRGYISNDYPYPFVDVTTIGYGKTLLNSAGLLLFFILTACLLIAFGHLISKKKSIKA